MSQETKQKLRDQLEMLLHDLEHTLVIPEYWVAHTEYKLRKAEATVLEQEITSGIDSEPHQDILDTITHIRAYKYQRVDTPAFLLIREKQADLGMTLDQIEEEARAKVANGGQLSPEEIRQKRDDLAFASQRIQALETSSPAEWVSGWQLPEDVE